MGFIYIGDAAGMGGAFQQQINIHASNLPLIIQAVTLIAEQTTEPQRSLAVLRSRGSIEQLDQRLGEKTYAQLEELEEAVQTAIRTLEARGGQ